MAGVVLSQGLTAMVGSAMDIPTFLADLNLKLFVNNHTPVVGDTDANYTEASFVGYSPVALGAWTDDGIDGNNNEKYSYAAQAFTCSGASTDTIYGYYLENGAGTVIMAEAAAAPFVMSNGLTYTVVLAFYLGQLSGTP